MIFSKKLNPTAPNLTNYVTAGNLAACAVCHYGGYYYIRVMFS